MMKRMARRNVKVSDVKKVNALKVSLLSFDNIFCGFDSKIKRVRLRW